MGGFPAPAPTPATRPTKASANDIGQKRTTARSGRVSAGGMSRSLTRKLLSASSEGSPAGGGRYRCLENSQVGRCEPIGRISVVPTVESADAARCLSGVANFLVYRWPPERRYYTCLLRTTRKQQGSQVIVGETTQRPGRVTCAVDGID